jgi:hypothetical protein
MEMPQSNKHTAQPVSTRVDAYSATRSLVKVESGIKGLLPTSWAPPIYSVSLLTKLRCALGGNGLLRLASCALVPRSHLSNAKPTEIEKKSEKTPQGLYNVGFIGNENNRGLKRQSQRPRIERHQPERFEPL